MAAPARDVPAASSLERALRLFTDVRAGEARTGLRLFFAILLVLCSYYFVKPLREGWLAVSEVGDLTSFEIKAYSSFGQSLLLVFVVSAYGRFVSRWSRRMLLTRTTLFLMSNMLIFWFLQPEFFVRHLPGTGLAFYLWVGIFGVFVVAQFWAFAADIYPEEQGRRLLPLVAIGATGGAVVGSSLAEQIVELDLLGTEYLLLAALVPLALSLWLLRLVDAETDVSPAPAPGQEITRGGVQRDAVRLVLSTKFLLAVAGVTLLLNWVNTNGENLLFRVVQDVVAEGLRVEGVADPAAVLERVREATTLFYSDFFFWVNLVALLLQAFLASRLLKYGGFGAIFLLLPVIALGSYTAMALVPVLAVIKVMKIAENATDYSINNTARHVLWLPLTREVTFKAKPTIDSLFVRMGDGLAALTALVGVHLLALSLQGYFALNVSLVCLWLALAIWVVREHRMRSGDAGSPESAAVETARGVDGNR